MRGPGIKLDLDVRRLWTCPACQKQRRLPGDVSSQLCNCREGGVFMQLTSDSRVLKRIERLTPIPYPKLPVPEGWRIPDPVEEAAAEPVPRPIPEPLPEPIPEPIPQPGPIPYPDPVPEPRAESEVADEFGANLDLPPEPLREPESA